MSENKNIKKLDNDNFEATIKNGVCLIDFWAAWCMPCRMQGPIIDTLADKIGAKINICKLNVDDFPELAGKYGVMSIPTLIVFKNGQPVNQFVGVQNKETLLNALENV